MPKFSTPATRLAEDRTLDFIAQQFGWMVKRGSDFAPLDAEFYCGREVAAEAEVKIRTHRFGTFPDVWLEQVKYNSLVASAVKGLFVVRWLDRVGYVNVKQITAPTWVIRGRADRGRADDFDPVALVPLSLFTTYQWSEPLCVE